MKNVPITKEPLVKVFAVLLQQTSQHHHYVCNNISSASDAERKCDLGFQELGGNYNKMIIN